MRTVLHQAVLHGFHDKPAFLKIVCNPFQINRVALSPGGPELLAFPPGVVGDNTVCRVQNIAGRAVILFQPDHLRVGVAFFKEQDILNGRAAEFINALIIVAHHAEIPEF